MYKPSAVDKLSPDLGVQPEEKLFGFFDAQTNVFYYISMPGLNDQELVIQQFQVLFGQQPDKSSNQQSEQD